MALDFLTCGNCGTPLPEDPVNLPGDGFCLACGSPVRVRVFPALFEEPELPWASQALVVEGESTCFYHAHRRAAVLCSLCGRFLCRLCDIELGHRHLCPVCIEQGAGEGSFDPLEGRRSHYDSVALFLAFAAFPLWLMCFSGLFVAVMAVVVALWYWKTPDSILPRSKWRSVLAITLGSLQVAGFLFGVTFFIVGLIVG